jgi:hypothetical protein
MQAPRAQSARQYHLRVHRPCCVINLGCGWAAATGAAACSADLDCKPTLCSGSLGGPGLEQCHRSWYLPS